MTHDERNRRAAFIFWMAAEFAKRGTSAREALRLARATFKAVMADCAFGDPDHDWSPDGARTCAYAYEIDYWD